MPLASLGWKFTRGSMMGMMKLLPVKQTERREASEGFNMLCQNNTTVQPRAAEVMHIKTRGWVECVYVCVCVRGALPVSNFAHLYMIAHPVSAAGLPGACCAFKYLLCLHLLATHAGLTRI